jgi:hypothetical protein
MRKAVAAFVVSAAVAAFFAMLPLTGWVDQTMARVVTAVVAAGFGITAVVMAALALWYWRTSRGPAAQPSPPAAQSSEPVPPADQPMPVAEPPERPEPVRPEPGILTYYRQLAEDAARSRQLPACGVATRASDGMGRSYVDPCVRPRGHDGPHSAVLFQHDSYDQG